MKILTPAITTAILLVALTSILRADEAEALLPSRASIGPLLGSQFATHDSPRRRRWAISLAPLFASQALDAASSYGMRELNPLLASPNGGFGMKATGIKFGVVGALAGAEYLLIKKYPRSAKFFTIVNWTTAGATTGLAVHNYRLH